MTFILFSPYSPEGYMARITFRLIILNAFNNPMYCNAVCNRYKNKNKNKFISEQKMKFDNNEILLINILLHLMYLYI